MVNARDIVASPSPPPEEPTLFGHPKGLTVLFLTGMWEVFAIFGMRTVLIFYLVKQLGFSQKNAVELYALSSAACVLMGLFGALVADRWLGARRAVVLGALLMAVASFSLISPTLLYVGLGLMAVGNGLFKSTMVAQVGALYARDDPRRDRAFIAYKVGCNLGALSAPLVCGTLGAAYGWNYAFAASGTGMIVSIAVFLAGRAYLRAPASDARRAVAAANLDAVRHPLAVLAVVWCGSVLFWVAYRQIESTVALWADQQVDRSLALGDWSWVVPAAWFQSVNPCLIFIFAPLVNLWWSRREHRATVAGDLGKMLTGCLQLGAAFAVMGLAAGLAPAGALVSPGWLVLAIALLTLGELYVDPIGQALFNRLATRGLFSVYVSLWFFASLAAYFVAAWLGGVWMRVSAGTFFTAMAAASLAAAGLMYAARKVAAPPATEPTLC